MFLFRFLAKVLPMKWGFHTVFTDYCAKEPKVAATISAFMVSKDRLEKFLDYFKNAQNDEEIPYRIWELVSTMKYDQGFLKGNANIFNRRYNQQLTNLLDNISQQVYKAYENEDSNYDIYWNIVELHSSFQLQQAVHIASLKGQLDKIAQQVAEHETSKPDSDYDGTTDSPDTK